MGTCPSASPPFAVPRSRSGRSRSRWRAVGPWTHRRSRRANSSQPLVRFSRSGVRPLFVKSYSTASVAVGGSGFRVGGRQGKSAGHLETHEGRDHPAAIAGARRGPDAASETVTLLRGRRARPDDGRLGSQDSCPPAVRGSGRVSSSARNPRRRTATCGSRCAGCRCAASHRGGPHGSRRTSRTAGAWPDGSCCPAA